MLKTINFMVFLCIAFSINADEVVIKSEYANKSFSQVSLGILPVTAIDSVYIGMMRYMDRDAQLKKIEETFEKELPKHMVDYSSCAKASICRAIPYDGLKSYSLPMKHGKTMQMRLPAKNLDILQSPELPEVLLCLELPVIFDDSSLTYVDVGAIISGGLGQWVKAKPMEECLHYSCRFVFIDTKKDAAICYGTVTAEGCSTPQLRYGPDGVWSQSIQDLVKQIVEDTPFKMEMMK